LDEQSQGIDKQKNEEWARWEKSEVGEKCNRCEIGIETRRLKQIKEQEHEWNGVSEMKDKYME
jgi:hypothetical protein